MKWMHSDYAPIVVYCGKCDDWMAEGDTKFESIQEDFLRIFRYYRFLGIFENPLLIKDYDKVLSQYFEDSFNYLSNDLIRQEILKMFDTPFPLNSFFDRENSMKKRYWIDLVTKHFIKSNYEIGLKKCLNKINLLVD